MRRRINAAPMRRGVSLLEVIAAIALMSVVIVPVTSMMKSSAVLLDRTERSRQTSQRRETLRWLRSQLAADAILPGSVVASRTTLQYRSLREGDVSITRTGRQLIYRSSVGTEVLLDDVRNFNASLQNGLLRLTLLWNDPTASRPQVLTAMIHIAPTP